MARSTLSPISRWPSFSSRRPAANGVFQEIGCDGGAFGGCGHLGGDLMSASEAFGSKDCSLSAALLIHRLVAERFDGELRIGIGVNTGSVIAGTIGGGGKLEFTLIGDTVNVAARVEQLTKTTGDTILVTRESVDAMDTRPSGLADRGSHALKGKSASVQIFALDPWTHSPTSVADQK